MVRKSSRLKTDPNAKYEFILPMSDVENLSNVSLKFVNENELKNFLEPIL